MKVKGYVWLVCRRVPRRLIRRWHHLVFQMHWLHCQNSRQMMVFQSRSHAGRGLWQLVCCRQMDSQICTVLPAQRLWNEDFEMYIVLQDFSNTFDADDTDSKNILNRAWDSSIAVYNVVLVQSCHCFILYLNTENLFVTEALELVFVFVLGINNTAVFLVRYVTECLDERFC